MGRAGSVRVERRRELRAPAEAVWEWMCDARGLALFELNVFHAAARCEASSLEVGARVAIDHHLGFARERRVARITTLRRFELAWAESKAQGEDWFPHAQRFVLEPRDGGRCVVHNTLTGTFRLAGAGWWLVPWYRPLLARILDAENRGLARAVEGEG